MEAIGNRRPGATLRVARSFRDPWWVRDEPLYVYYISEFQSLSLCIRASGIEFNKAIPQPLLDQAWLRATSPHTPPLKPTLTQPTLTQTLSLTQARAGMWLTTVQGPRIRSYFSNAILMYIRQLTASVVLALSLPRVIKFKFPLHQKYYNT